MLFVGDDWAEESHDIELQDEQGRRLARARLEEGIAGIARLHELIGQQLDGDDDDGQVVAGIETDRGPWVQALVAAGYQVCPVNPLQVARFRESTSVSGAKSDPADAHAIADGAPAVPPAAAGRRGHRRGRRDQGGRPGAQDPDLERSRHMLRLRNTLREFFPAALAAVPPRTPKRGKFSTNQTPLEHAVRPLPAGLAAVTAPVLLPAGRLP